MAVEVVSFNSLFFVAYGGNWNFATDDFYATLHDGTFPEDRSDTVFSDFSSSELSTGNGYTSGGEKLTGQVYLVSGGNSWFDTNSVWTASGGSITASFMVVSNRTRNDKLVFWVDFDGSQSAGSGTDFIINPPSFAWFTVSRPPVP